MLCSNVMEDAMHLFNWLLIGLNVVILTALVWLIFYVYSKYEESRDKKGEIHL